MAAADLHRCYRHQHRTRPALSPALDRRPPGRPPVRPAGWPLFGVAALWFTDPHHDLAKTTLNPNAVPDHLVTTGPFGITRNPMYLANTLLLIGVAFVSGVAWFLPLAFISAYATQKVAIEGEEKVLAAKYGKKYRDYAKRVRRRI